MDVHLLRGCCLEAERSDAVSRLLGSLHLLLNDPDLAAVIEGVRTGSRILRELANLSEIHQDRLPLILEPLNFVLRCLSRSLRDITAYHDNWTRSRTSLWRNMYHQMTNEAGGLPLPGRFSVYNQYLSSVRDLLTR